MKVPKDQPISRDIDDRRIGIMSTKAATRIGQGIENLKDKYSLRLHPEGNPETAEQYMRGQDKLNLAINQKEMGRRGRNMQEHYEIMDSILEPRRNPYRSLMKSLKPKIPLEKPLKSPRIK